VETITRVSDARKDARHGNRCVARARLAFRGARNTLAAHVAAHDAAAPAGDPCQGRIWSPPEIGALSDLRP
jgi:hypothetical protein